MNTYMEEEYNPHPRYRKVSKRMKIIRHSRKR